jgi:hypothetical protein
VLVRKRLGVLAGLALCAGTGACAAGDQNPVIESIEPARVTQMQPTSATIRGRNFYAFASVSLDKENVGQIDSDWSVSIEGVAMDPNSITVVGDTTIDLVVPADLQVGYHDVTVVAPNGDTDTLEDGLFVIDDSNLSLTIEDSGGGAGKLVEDYKIAVGDSLDLYGVGRDPSASFLLDVDVSWQVSGTSGGLSAADGSQTSFLAAAVGTSTVSANHQQYGQASTGTLSVVECVVDSDCVDTCRSSNTCVSDACVQGPLDAGCGGMMTATFQEGVNGYGGTVDTSITELTPDFPLGSDITLIWQDTGGAKSASLIRFDNIFGNGARKVPLNSTILSATLLTEPLAPGGFLTDPGAASVVLVPWDDLVTWNSFGAAPGLDMSDMSPPFAPAPDSTTLLCPCPTHRLDVTASVVAMMAGSANNGWIFVPSSSTFEFTPSSEDPDPAIRPKLEISYLPPP